MSMSSLVSRSGCSWCDVMSAMSVEGEKKNGEAHHHEEFLLGASVTVLGF